MSRNLPSKSPDEIERLAQAVLTATAHLEEVPERTRRLADRRQRAVERLVAACGGAAGAARALGWPPSNVYRILAGDRGAKRRQRQREDRGAGALSLLAVLAATAGLSATIPGVAGKLRVWGTEVEARLAGEAVSMAGVPSSGQALRAELRRDDPALHLSGSATAGTDRGAVLSGPVGTAVQGGEAILAFRVGSACVIATVPQAGNASVLSRPAGACHA